MLMMLWKEDGLFSGHMRLSDFTIEVSNYTHTYTACRYSSDVVPQGGSSTLDCYSPMIARYVRIRTLNRNLFTVCEVVVTGHPYIGKWHTFEVNF